MQQILELRFVPGAIHPQWRSYRPQMSQRNPVPSNWPDEGMAFEMGKVLNLGLNDLQGLILLP